MNQDTVSRRDFLATGAAAAAVATAATPFSGLAGEEANGATLPRRKLGRTGVEVTILDQGSAFSIGDRHLNILHEEGVRTIDTADCYESGKSERSIGEWLNKSGHRKEYFLITKEHPSTPEDWVRELDDRLENSQQDYVDLYFIHQLGDDEYPLEESVNWPKDKGFAKAAEAIRKSGKAKFVGFSTHCRPIERRIQLLNNAAEGGWVDAIMVAVDPTLLRNNAELNRALDACHKAGIGLICMKEMRGLPTIKEAFPQFEARGLTPVGAVLTAIWTDERFATICSHMQNITQLKENAQTARSFTPMTDDELTAVQRMLDGYAKGYCVGCDGSCQRAAGTPTAFSDIARYLCYYEQDGNRDGARRLLASLPPHARDWSAADLAAASKACVSKLDFASLLSRAARKLA